MPSSAWPAVNVRRLMVVAGALAVVTAGMLALRDQLDKAHVALLYLLLVLGASAWGGRRIGIGAAAGAFLLFNYLFLKPYYTLVIEDRRDWLVLLVFFATSIVAAELLDRQRRFAQRADARARELDQLATLGAETLNAARAEQALAAIAAVIQQAAGIERCELFAWQGERRAARAVASAPPQAAHSPPPADRTSLIAYVGETRRTAIEWDDGTVHLLDDAAADAPTNDIRTLALAMPLVARGETVGILRMSNATPFRLTVEQWRVVTALGYYAALGIERARLERSEETAETLRRADRLKDALLAAVSHDLRTPLTTIKALAHEIAAAGNADASIIEDEADRLAALVEQLLELSQLDAGAVPLRAEVNTVDDLIGAAMQRVGGVLAARRVEVRLPDGDLVAGRFDLGQSLRVLVNLLENAVKYSPETSTIDVSARRIGGQLEIAVADRGAGVAPGDRDRIFQPFYRAAGAPADVRGAGLGLAIARGLARAQGGDVTYADNAGGGSVFVFRLPAEPVATI